MLGQPDPLTDPAVRARKDHLVREARFLMAAMKDLYGATSPNPLLDPPPPATPRRPAVPLRADDPQRRRDRREEDQEEGDVEELLLVRGHERVVVRVGGVARGGERGHREGQGGEDRGGKPAAHHRREHLALPRGALPEDVRGGGHDGPNREQSEEDDEDAQEEERERVVHRGEQRDVRTDCPRPAEAEREHEAEEDEEERAHEEGNLSMELLEALLVYDGGVPFQCRSDKVAVPERSEEHTSELQSRLHLV